MSETDTPPSETFGSANLSHFRVAPASYGTIAPRHIGRVLVAILPIGVYRCEGLFDKATITDTACATLGKSTLEATFSLCNSACYHTMRIGSDARAQAMRISLPNSLTSSTQQFSSPSAA